VNVNKRKKKFTSEPKLKENTWVFTYLPFFKQQRKKQTNININVYNLRLFLEVIIWVLQCCKFLYFKVYFVSQSNMCPGLVIVNNLARKCM
jgi:hypothetical protein